MTTNRKNPQMTSDGKETKMRYTWLDDYLLKKKGVTKDLQPDWN